MSVYTQQTGSTLYTTCVYTVNMRIKYCDPNKSENITEHQSVRFGVYDTNAANDVAAASEWPRRTMSKRSTWARLHTATRGVGYHAVVLWYNRSYRMAGGSTTISTTSTALENH